MLIGCVNNNNINSIKFDFAVYFYLHHLLIMMNVTFLVSEKWYNLDGTLFVF